MSQPFSVILQAKTARLLNSTLQDMTTAAPTHPQNISTVDALWTLFLNQSKSVRNEISKRMQALDAEERQRRKMKAYEATLTPEQREKAHEIASTIVRCVREVEEAYNQGKSIGTPIDDFLRELDEEEEE